MTLNWRQDCLLKVWSSFRLGHIPVICSNWRITNAFEFNFSAKFSQVKWGRRRKEPPNSLICFCISACDAYHLPDAIKPFCVCAAGCWVGGGKVVEMWQRLFDFRCWVSCRSRWTLPKERRTYFNANVSGNKTKSCGNKKTFGIRRSCTIYLIVPK